MIKWLIGKLFPKYVIYFDNGTRETFNNTQVFKMRCKELKDRDVGFSYVNKW